MLTLLMMVASAFTQHTDVIGETYSNTIDSESSSAITYNKASIGKYYLQDTAGWVSPRIVDDLSLVISDGPIINTAETIPSNTQYYDGSSNLSSSSLRCRLMVSMTSCFSASNCGWCKSLGRCIPGSEEAPLYPCESGMYIYSN